MQCTLIKHHAKVCTAYVLPQCVMVKNIPRASQFIWLIQHFYIYTVGTNTYQYMQLWNTLTASHCSLSQAGSVQSLYSLPLQLQCNVSPITSFVCLTKLVMGKTLHWCDNWKGRVICLACLIVLNNHPTISSRAQAPANNIRWSQEDNTPVGQPTLFCSCTLLPSESKNRETPPWPFCAALISGVYPHCTWSEGDTMESDGTDISTSSVPHKLV